MFDMNWTRVAHRIAALLLFSFGVAAPLQQEARAQQQDVAESDSVAVSITVEVTPERLSLEKGASDTLRAQVMQGGQAIDGAQVLFFSRDPRGVSVDRATGAVEALAPGTYTILALHPREAGRVMKEVPVEVAFPPIERVAFAEGVPERVYAGTQVPLRATVTDVTGATRPDADVRFTTSGNDRATVDAFGQLVARRPGEVMVTAVGDSARAEQRVRIVENPTVRLVLEGGKETAVTGEVLSFSATPRDAQRRPVPGAPVTYAVQGRATDALAPPATAQVDSAGRFVAEWPGEYTVVATSGGHVARQTVRVAPRQVGGRFEVVGRGKVQDVHTSDLWVWEGAGGRDYAITGTWGANGDTYFWDVTDRPARLPSTR